MAKYINILEKTIEMYKNKELNNEPIEKFTMGSLIDSIRMSKNAINEEKKKKRTNAIITPYNKFVKEEMSKRMELLIKMSGAEHMKIIAKEWNIYKKTNNILTKKEKKLQKEKESKKEDTSEGQESEKESKECEKESESEDEEL
jgi:hypothetical protein